MVDYIKGIDISSIQNAKPIDWQWIVDQGIKFVICRAGVGNGGIDKNYTANVAAAKAVGLKVAAYHFVYPLPTIPSQPLRDPILQAQYHYKSAGGELACCDFEWPDVGQWSKWGCTAQQINDWGLAYLAEYSRLDGRKMIFYTYPSYAISVKMSAEYAQYPLWIASYQPNKPWVPAPFHDWVMWQYSGGTAMKLSNGIDVDTNWAKDLSLWDVPGQPVSEPIPDHQPSDTPDPAIVDSVQPAAAPPPAPTGGPVVSTSSGNILNTIWNAISGLFKGK